jgi:hypothetical protein
MIPWENDLSDVSQTSYVLLAGNNAAQIFWQ